MKPEILILPVGDNPPKATLYYGQHVLDVLKELPDESVHAIVTSPPYYSLRRYGTEPVIFGGDSECIHEWSGSEEEGQWTCSKCGAWKGELGQEPSPELFVLHLVEILHEAKRVLRSDGQLWLNLGDSFANDTKWGGSSGGKHVKALHGDTGIGRDKKSTGLMPKSLIGIPWRVALALQEDGWCLRNDNIWAKKNSMPSPVSDRFSCKHEHIFLLTKEPHYFFDLEAVRVPFESGSYDEDGNHCPSQNWFEKNEGERKIDNIEANLGDMSGPPRRVGRGLFNPGGKNPGDVWHLATHPYPKAHFACWPPAIPERCIKAGTSERGYCPVCGAPWIRQVEKEKIPDRPNRVQGREGDTLGEAHGKDGRSGSRCSLSVRTLGWEPSCDCGSDLPLTRAVVLDLFSGSGTTGMVALQLGRDYIGIDRSEKYLPMAKERISGIEEAPESPVSQDGTQPSITDLFGR